MAWISVSYNKVLSKYNIQKCAYCLNSAEDKIFCLNIYNFSLSSVNKKFMKKSLILQTIVFMIFIFGFFYEKNLFAYLIRLKSKVS